MKLTRYDFTSDNTAGICPEVWAALEAANVGSAPTYGNDDWTSRASDLVRSVFETDCEVYFVSTGTVANALALAACCPDRGGIICHETAHIVVHEAGASEFFSGGGKLQPVAGPRGKFDPAAIEEAILSSRAAGSPKPRALSLTQSTELGTLYTVAETKALTAVARKHGLVVHMDGARFANAAAALADHEGATPADVAWRAGVDVLSFGGIKNGLVESEAIVFFKRDLALGFADRQRRAGQLSSKMRFQSAQWIGLLRDGTWLRNASHANAMARRLAGELSRVPGITFGVEPETNALFVKMPAPLAATIRSMGWDLREPRIAGHRLRCSWATQPADVDALAADFRSAAKSAQLERPRTGS
jgi:threonine aldolase